MEKMTFHEVRELFFNHNRENENAKPIYAVAVISEDSFKDYYSVYERSYKFSSDNLAFKAGKNSNSIYADCLDGKDDGVRLDIYVPIDWKVDYCYLVD